MLVMQRARSAQARPYFPGYSAAAGTASRHPTGRQRTHARDPSHSSSSCGKAVDLQARHTTAGSHLRYVCSLRSFTRLLPLPQRLQKLLRARIEAGMAPASMRERVSEERDVIHG